MDVKRKIALQLKAKGYKAGIPQWRTTSVYTNDRDIVAPRSHQVLKGRSQAWMHEKSGRLESHVQNILVLLRRHHPKDCRVCHVQKPTSNNADSTRQHSDMRLHALEDDLKQLTEEYMSRIKKESSDSDDTRLKQSARQFQSFVTELENKVKL